MCVFERDGRGSGKERETLPFFSQLCIVATWAVLQMNNARPSSVPPASGGSASVGKPPTSGWAQSCGLAARREVEPNTIHLHALPVSTAVTQLVENQHILPYITYSESCFVALTHHIDCFVSLLPKSPPYWMGKTGLQWTCPQCFRAENNAYFFMILKPNFIYFVIYFCLTPT